MEEKDLVRLWIVGGQMLPTSLPELFEWHGNLEEGVRLAADLQFFLEEKERVGRFDQAIQNLSKSDAEMLAGILKEKLTSPEM